MHFVAGSQSRAEHFIRMGNWFLVAVLVGFVVFVTLLAFVMAL
jgi:hypothetical protein